MPIGVYPHKPIPAEVRKKMSEAHKKIKHEGQFAKGSVPWNKDLKGIHLSIKSEWQKGESPKGSMVFRGRESKFQGTLQEYKRLHYWVTKTKGKPLICIFCGTGEKLQWANRSNEYKQETSDWLSLCVSCHFTYDDQYSRRELVG